MRYRSGHAVPARSLPRRANAAAPRTARRGGARPKARRAKVERGGAGREASGSDSQMGWRCVQGPGGFARLRGDDAGPRPGVALGGTGVISVVSNVVPGEMARL